MATKEFQEPPIENELTSKDGGSKALLSPEWLEWFYELTRLQTEWELVKVRINPASVAANTTASQSITITQVVDDDDNTLTLKGNETAVKLGDYVIQIYKPTHTAGFFINTVRVTADNTMDIEFGNVTASAIDPGAETYTLIVLKGS